ncbi:MATE family efflux transporter [Kineosporia sp. NBRC 101731]|uniref:MATE family efflux transporter n=1 Tax=Kineosporia sp. NBRC 101731 TaxID=3032199 RepID=UPI0024A00539|nr:MATE family efflux transporter [Kineosporia sp. NBRC 101731]GLY26908.1 MATE family efflux transporter [Kineosporia sp. NBRC 101731]
MIRLSRNPGRSNTDRQILALALPALGALIAEPMFLLVDSAIVGRLGTTELAGLGIAGGILTTAVYIFVFLAYGTTSSVARLMGAGDRTKAIAIGMDAAWLAAGIGVCVALLGYAVAPYAVDLVGAAGAEPGVREAAITYLRWALPGVPAMLIVLALVGVLRGLQNTRVTLWIAVSGALLNAGLNLLLVHGVGWGIAGSAIGTTISQCAMAIAATGYVVGDARRAGVSLKPHLAGVRLAGRTGVPLLIRTMAMRLLLLLTTAVAAGFGAPSLAAHQVALNVWNLLALGLDALAIAGQALTGTALGRGDVEGVREATQRMVRWGIGAGVVFAGVLLLCAGALGPLFSDDPEVRRALTGALIVAALTQPVAGYVFVLDGVLIGAGDGRFLAYAAVIQTALYAPAAIAIGLWGPDGKAGLVWLWVAFAGGWMVVRAVVLRRRERGDQWLVTGAYR